MRLRSTIRLFGAILVPTCVLAFAVNSASLTGSYDKMKGPAETADFDEYVRQSLLRNPHVLVEVFELLENKEQEYAELADKDLIERHASVLFGEVEHEAAAIVEFFDYNCGYCKQAHLELEAIRAMNDTLPILKMHLPILGEGSLDLAKNMLAVRDLYGEQAYHEMHSRLMQDDGRLKANIQSEFANLGYDIEKISQVASGAEVQAEINMSQSLARELGINGTPAFVTRNKIFRGFVRRSELMNAALSNNETNK